MRSLAADQAAPNTGAGSAIVVDSWTVCDGYQQEFEETIAGLLDRVRTLDGFIEGELLQGANPTRFVSWVRMRSTLDRRRTLDDREVRALMRAAERVARPDLHSYDVVRAFGPAGA